MDAEITVRQQAASTANDTTGRMMAAVKTEDLHRPSSVYLEPEIGGPGDDLTSIRLGSGPVSVGHPGGKLRGDHSVITWAAGCGLRSWRSNFHRKLATLVRLWQRIPLCHTPSEPKKFRYVMAVSRDAETEPEPPESFARSFV